MTYYVAVLPSIWQPYTTDCLNSMSPTFRRNTLVIDNTIVNRGVARSWNLGIDALHDTADWLILISAAIRFGSPGGDDFIEQLDNHAGENLFDIVEARPVYGWHCIAFHRTLFERIGRFDENLTNYYNDIDFTLRIQKHYAPADPPWNKVTINVQDMGMAHGLHLAGVIDSADHYINYMTRKWGRHPDHSAEPAYDHPFNNPLHELSYWVA